MSPESWGLIGAILGTIIGSGTSILTTYLINKKSAQLQKNTEIFKRTERFQEFQTRNLLDMQEELAKAMRIVGRIHIHDVENFRKNGKWMAEKIENELNNQLVESLRNLSILTERIANENLRENIIHFRINISDCLFAKNLSDREKRINDLSSTYHGLMPKIGSVLRDNY